MNCLIETLGCPKNVADSESAAGILERAGHRIVNDPSDADVILVNTCGFINDAKEESIDRIFEMAQYREQGTKLIVSGCLSQRYGEVLYKSMPEVDLFMGVNEYAKLPEYLESLQKTDNKKHSPRICGCLPEYEELGKRKSLGSSYTMYLKIAEGCDNRCAYCVIPSIRGHYRSRKPEEILAEARDAAEQGCKELILVAQDVTAYGMDFEEAFRLPDLLKALCKIDEIRWIRLLYCYEDRITDDLIRVMKDNPKICRYLDIPIQHASDKVLKRMNRRSTEASIRGIIEKLRRELQDICIRTTLITGFPGEKQEDFHILKNFVEDMKFDRLGVFAYSKEENTEAAAMPSQVKESTKLRRRDQIMAMQMEISLRHNQEKIGSVQEVLVEEKDEEPGTWIGRSRFDAPDIDNSVIFTSERELKPGDLVRVLITDAFDYDLVGKETER